MKENPSSSNGVDEHMGFDRFSLTKTLLCSLLSPIGQHRANHIVKSKCKRSKKRKRQQSKSEEVPTKSDIPPPPEISSFIAVGLNTITRSLESLAQKTKPCQSPNTIPPKSDDAGETSQDLSSKEEQEVGTSKKIAVDSDEYAPVDAHFSAIFVLRSSQPAILHTHLPQLIATASLAYPELPATRLVQLPRGSEGRLCEVLGLPRVSFIGLLEGAPHSQSLVDLIRQCVPKIEIPWLHEAKQSTYMPVKINAIETFVTAPKKNQT